MFWLALAAAALIIAATVSFDRRVHQGGGRELAAGPHPMVVTNMAASTLRHGGVAALQALMQELNEVRPLPLFAVGEEGRDLLGRTVPQAAWQRAASLASEQANSNAARLVSSRDGNYLLFVPLTEDLPRPMPRYLPWLLIVLGALASVGLSVLIAWYLSRPINSLRSAFDAVAAGKLDTRITPLIGGRRDEIADLGRDFDRMAEQLQAHVSAQRRLLNDVSHEVRSPLARLNAAVGLLRQDPRKLDISLQRIEREVTHLHEMMEEILTLSRLETGNLPLKLEPVELGDLVCAVVQDARFEAEAQGKSAEARGLPEVQVLGEETLLYRAVENIVRNAVKYTAPGTTVEVALRKMAGARVAQLEVTDRGPGIPQRDLGRIFEPFYRSSVPGNTKGVGLGLAIAHRAIAMSRGSIRAQNRPEGGLRVEIRLPLA